MAKVRRKKKINPDRIAKAMVKGLTLSWHDTCPNNDGFGGMGRVSYGHSNPVHRVGVRKIVVSSYDRIKSTMPMMWSITATTVFEYDAGEDRHEQVIEFYGVLDDIGGVLVDGLMEDRRKGADSAYIHVEFDMRCIGSSPPPSIEEKMMKFLSLTDEPEVDSVLA